MIGWIVAGVVGVIGLIVGGWGLLVFVDTQVARWDREDAQAQIHRAQDRVAARR